MTNAEATVALHIEPIGSVASVAVITLNRPDRLNSFTGVMHAQLRDALDHVDALRTGDAPVRALVLTGSGRGFCAGQDLRDPEFPLAEGGDLAHPIATNYNPLARRLRATAIPTIAAVNGIAAGAGANLALLCDITIAARSAKFVQPFCRLGVVPDTGGTFTLPRLIGEARARAVMLLGTPVSAEQAKQWGMIWDVVGDDELMPAAIDLAHELASMPTAGLALTTRALAASSDNTFDEQLHLEHDLQREAGRTQDFREGVQAFLDKRTPAFKGR